MLFFHREVFCLKKIMSKKFYVVRKGKKTWVFDDREMCKASVSGVTWAQYKSFKNQSDAVWAYSQWYEVFKWKDVRTVIASKKWQSQKQWPRKKHSIAVDAACSWNPGVMEYRGVDVQSGQQLFFSWPRPLATVNIGEYLAIIDALQWCEAHDNVFLCLYSDSRTALSWVKKKKVNTGLVHNSQTAALWDKLKKAEEWLQSHDISLPLVKRETAERWEIPADFGRK